MDNARIRKLEAILERELRRATHTHVGDVVVSIDGEMITATIGGNHELGQPGDTFKCEIGSDDDQFCFIEVIGDDFGPRTIEFSFPSDWPND